MLHETRLPQSLWAEAISTAVYILNRLPTKSVTDTTPYERWTLKKPTISHLRVFGCEAFAHILDERGRKMDYKAQKLTFIGYTKGVKGYRLVDMSTRRLSYHRNVVFNEKPLLSLRNAGSDTYPEVEEESIWPTSIDETSESVFDTTRNHDVGEPRIRIQEPDNDEQPSDSPDLSSTRAYGSTGHWRACLLQASNGFSRSLRMEKSCKRGV